LIAGSKKQLGPLGANPFWVFVFITLPLIALGVIAGMILSFAKAMAEFGATITFVSNIPGETQTLPSAIYTLTQVPGGDLGALRLTLVSISISMAALLVSELMARPEDLDRMMIEEPLVEVYIDYSGVRLSARPENRLRRSVLNPCLPSMPFQRV
jgi:ABC-type sulfate transport system permease subunit